MYCLLRTHTFITTALLFCVTAQADEPVPSAAPARTEPNRLSKETSPYLLLHAHNPVDWYPWGPEAFEKARQENKPIFLSIGYSSCYWCHVMERLVFSDPEIAAYMNKHFVNIKVDREERPDVDEIYMTALTIYYQLVQAPQGGGWPLSMFLTPTGKPFTGGSYFPLKDDEATGRPGFPTIMKDVQKLWETRQKDLEQNADTITGYVQTFSKPQLNLQPVTLDRAMVTAASAALVKTFDAEFGGVDMNPERPEGHKFPVPTKLAFLQAELRRSKDPALGNVIYLTLDKIAAGGIYDHLAGGFHRYSTDRYWHVPHFEKMLYDQAQLACVYLEAFRQTKKPLYRDTAVGILDFVLNQMTDRQGGFYSALDAETDAVEGKFYVWSFEEIETVLGKEDAALFGKVYGLEAEKRFEPGYVLHIAQPLEKVAAEVNLSVMDLDFKLAGMREKLRKERDKRKAPLLDDKVLASWNGLMIRAYAEAGKLLERTDYARTAEVAAQFVLTKMLDDQQRLTRTWRKDQAKLNAYLDDYAFVADGLLALHQATGDEKWLTAARKLTDEQITRFWDDRQGGFYFTATDHEEMIVRIKNAYDSVLPSGNSVSVRNLLRLAELTGEKSYREKAETTLKLFAPSLERAPRGMTNMALALSEFLEGPVQPESQTSGPIEQTTLKQPVPEEMPAEVVTGRPYFSVDKLPAGQTCYVCVVLTIQEGWHINATPGRPAELMPAFNIKSKLGTKLTKPFFPQPIPATVKWSDKEVQVYEKQVYIYGQVEVPPNAAGLTEELELYLRYQVCNDEKCLLPKVVSMKGKLQVANVGEEVKSVNQQFFKPKEN